MYVHPSHRFNDRHDMLSLIESHPLGAWVVPAPEGLLANHVPFLLDRSRGEHGTLVAHVSRANPVWRALQHAGPSVVLFRGPQAYITPNWYPTKTTHEQVVPTWDYVAVNAHGIARAIDDDDWLRDLVERLTQSHESSQPVPWQVSDAPGAYIDKMLRAIVGIEAKLKASQDEAMGDRLGTVQGLGSVHALSAPAPGVWAEAMRGAGRAVVASTTSGLQRGSAPPRPPARRVAPRRGRCGVVGTRQGSKPCLAPPPCSPPRLGTTRVQTEREQTLQATGSDEARQMADWVRRAIDAQAPDNAL